VNKKSCSIFAAPNTGKTFSTTAENGAKKIQKKFWRFKKEVLSLHPLFDRENVLYKDVKKDQQNPEKVLEIQKRDLSLQPAFKQRLFIRGLQERKSKKNRNSFGY